MIDSDPHTLSISFQQSLSSVVFSEGFIIPSCSVNHASSRMLGWYISGELERIRKETVIDYSKNNAGIFLKLLTKTTKVPGQDSLCSGRYSNIEPPEHECIALPLHRPGHYVRG